MTIKKNDIFRIKSGILTGVKAKLIRQSARTGSLTLELVEAKGAFKVGDEVNIARYDCEKLSEN